MIKLKLVQIFFRLPRNIPINDFSNVLSYLENIRYNVWKSYNAYNRDHFFDIFDTINSIKPQTIFN